MIYFKYTSLFILMAISSSAIARPNGPISNTLEPAEQEQLKKNIADMMTCEVWIPTHKYYS